METVDGNGGCREGSKARANSAWRLTLGFMSRLDDSSGASCLMEWFLFMAIDRAMSVGTLAE